jgi:YbbR domain-containing protein
LRDWLAILGRHKLLKLLSLFLAIALWLAVGGEERTETNLNIPLELVNLNPQLMVTSEVPSALQVRVVGPRGMIRNLSQSRIIHTLDLGSYQAGRHTIPLGLGSFSFPRGVQITRIQPNQLVLELTPSITRTLPVQPVFSGRPPEGYEVRSVRIRPPQVTVKGPASELENLKFIPTVPLNLSRLTGSLTLAADLDFKNLNLTLTERVPLLAEVDIAPKVLSRTFTGLPVTPQPQPAQLSPGKVSVSLRGPWPQVKNLNPAELKPFVDTGGLSRGRHLLRVQLKLPEGLTLEKISPATLQARVGK